MTKLLVQGEAILAKDVVDQGNEIRSPDQIIPKHVVEGWQIVDVEVPDGFTCAGYTFNGLGVVKKPEPVAPVLVPQSVTRRQAMQQLRIEGITEDQIITNINAMAIPQLQKDLAIIEFKESQTFERSRPLVSQLGAMLGKDAAGIDAMFIAASKL
jgi:hypothetical protein